MKTTLRLCLLTLFLAGTASVAQAHKVTIFAYAEGNEILGEASFSGGRAARQAEVYVETEKDGERLLTLRTDDQGSFSFPIPEKARQQRLNLRIVLKAGEAHRNDWLLTAEEYLGPTTGGAATNAAVESTGGDQRPKLPEKAEKAVVLDEQQLRLIVGQVLEEKLAPIKHMLIKRPETSPRLKDIIGGIGYIIGVAGIIYYFRSKKGDRK